MTNARLENFALNLLLTIKKENVEKTGNRLRKLIIFSFENSQVERRTTSLNVSTKFVV